MTLVALGLTRALKMSKCKVFCTEHFNIFILYKQTTCTFPKLIF